MSWNRLLLLLVLLVAPAALAKDKKPSEEEDDAEYGESSEYEPISEEEKAPRLKGSRRFSPQVGWRYTPNTRFLDTYYTRSENRGLERAGGPIGGPLVVGTFAYSPLDWLELGIDMFATYERMRLTDRPGLNVVTFGGMVGLRFQRRLEIGSEGFIPFVGVLLGPTFTGAYFDGGRSVETFTNGIGATAGGTLRLTREWGLSFEYRLTYAQGRAERIGAYNAGGSWLAVGLTYILPKVEGRPLSRNF